MVGIVADYRVKRRHGTTPFECVADGKAALRWVRRHAQELGVDPRRIAAGGGSAGGHVAAAAALCTALEEPGADRTVSCRPDALLLFNPVTDLTGRLGGRWGDDPEAGSPLHHVDASDPPTIVFHGKADTTVAFESAETFCDAMENAGNRCELVGYDGRPHGFFNYGRSRAAYTSTVWHMDRFLASLGYVEGQPVVGRPGDPTW